MPMDKWDKCGAAVDVDSLKGRVCYGGLDLSSKIDLTAFALVFPAEDESGLYDVLCKFYCPEDTIGERSRIDNVRYDIWRDQGFITATPGNVIDYTFIERDILQATKDYQLMQIGFDPWNATNTATRLQQELNPTSDENGILMVEMRQGARTFNEPSKDLLVQVMQGKIRHGNNPVLRWCADNLVMRSDANGNVAPDKEKATEKIDGMVALIMAYGRAMVNKDDAEPEILIL